jgi:hypothetical protein
MNSAPDPARVGEKRVGPHLALSASCYGCAFERSVSYRCQSDSGHDIFCDHPESNGRSVGDTRWTTPDWCPVGSAMLTLRNHIMEARNEA